MARTLLALFCSTLAAGCTGPGDAAARQDGELDLTAAWDPAPPRAGRNTLDLHVADSVGDPVDGAAVTVDPQMLAHGHGSTEDPLVTAEGDGDYRAYPVTFQMAGTWLVTVTASEGNRTGRLELEVDIP